MSFRESFFDVKDLLVEHLQSYGFSANSNTGWTSLLTQKVNTSLTIDVPLSLVYSDDFNITGGLKTSNNSKLVGKTVKLKVGNTIVSTTTTNSSGDYSFTTSPVSAGNHSFQVIFEGSNNFNSCNSSVVERVAGKETTILTINSPLQNSQFTESTLTITGVLTDNDGIPLVNKSIFGSVSENQFTSTKSTTTNNNGEFSIIFDNLDNLSYDSHCFTIEYDEERDYSASSIDLYVERHNPILFQPPLDGTDSITSWTSMTNTTSNGIYQTHGSFLTEGWSNEGLWELDFDVKCTNWKYIGLMPVCMPEINPFTDAKATNYACVCWEGLIYFGGFGLTSWVSQDSLSKIKDSNWHHVKITKQSSTRLRTIIDDTYTAVGEYPNLVNATTLHIGSRDNPSSRNYGGIVNYKNIIVKKI